MGRILILLLALWAAGSQAQAPEAPANGDREVAAPDAQEPAPGPVDSDAGERQQPGADPFDYEASEQISEDLSVSFPVDI